MEVIATFFGKLINYVLLTTELVNYEVGKFKKPQLCKKQTKVYKKNDTCKILLNVCLSGLATPTPYKQRLLETVCAPHRFW